MAANWSGLESQRPWEYDSAITVPQIHIWVTLQLRIVQQGLGFSSPMAFRGPHLKTVLSTPLYPPPPLCLLRPDAHGSLRCAGFEGAYPESAFGGSSRVSSDENGFPQSWRIRLRHDRSRIHGGLPRHSSQVRINELNVMRFTFLPLTISSIFSPPQSSMG